MKGLRNFSCILLCFALAFGFIGGAFSKNATSYYRLLARADGITVGISADKTEYSVGDSVSFEIVLSGIEAGAELSGEITVAVSGGLSELSHSAPIAISGKSSEDGKWSSSTVKAKITGVDAKVKISAVLSVNSAEQQSVSSGDIPLTVKTVENTAAPTPSSTATPAATAVPAATATPSATSAATPELTAEPSETPAHTEEPTAEPTATMTVIATPEPTVNSGEGVVTVTDAPLQTPDFITPTEAPDTEKNPIPVGAVVFWSIVSLIVGIWIGIFIGSVIWRKKAVFMTSSERKIIGRY